METERKNSFTSNICIVVQTLARLLTLSLIAFWAQFANAQPYALEDADSYEECQEQFLLLGNTYDSTYDQDTKAHTYTADIKAIEAFKASMLSIGFSQDQLCMRPDYSGKKIVVVSLHSQIASSLSSFERGNINQDRLVLEEAFSEIIESISQENQGLWVDRSNQVACKYDNWAWYKDSPEEFSGFERGSEEARKFCDTLGLDVVLQLELPLNSGHKLIAESLEVSQINEVVLRFYDEMPNDTFQYFFSKSKLALNFRKTEFYVPDRTFVQIDESNEFSSVKYEKYDALEYVLDDLRYARSVKPAALQVIEGLLQAGANPAGEDVFSGTYLELAFGIEAFQNSDGTNSLAELLIEYGADLYETADANDAFLHNVTVWVMDEYNLPNLLIMSPEERTDYLLKVANGEVDFYLPQGITNSPFSNEPIDHSIADAIDTCFGLSAQRKHGSPEEIYDEIDIDDYEKPVLVARRLISHGYDIDLNVYFDNIDVWIGDFGLRDPSPNLTVLQECADKVKGRLLQ